MGFLDFFKPNLDKLVAKRDVRGLAKLMDQDDLVVRLSAERGLRQTVLGHHTEIAPKHVETAISKLVIRSVLSERFEDLDPLARIDKAAVIQVLVEGVQNHARRIGRFINRPPDVLTIAMRSDMPGMCKEGVYESDAELISLRRQLYGMMGKLREMLGADPVVHVRSLSKGVDGEWWIENELGNWERSKRS